MRILVLNYEFPPLGAGAGNASANISKHLVQFGAQVAVLTSHFKDLPMVEKRDGYTVYRTRVPRRRIDRCSPAEMGAFVILSLFKARRLAMDFQPDILHVFFGIPTGPVGLFLRKSRGIPYILALRGGDVPGFLGEQLKWVHFLTGPITKAVWSGASAIIANSRGLSDLARKAMPDREVGMVPNGVDSQLFRPAEGKAEGGPVKLLFVGRLVDQKAVNLIIESVRLLTDGGHNVTLEVVGDGPRRESLIELANTLHLGGKVRFTGWLSKADLVLRYQSADIFVFPSFEEGMPNAVLESMACGLPIIATDIYGHLDLVQQNDNGLLVPTGQAPALAHSVALLVEDASLRRDMGAKSRLRALESDWKAVARKYMDISVGIVKDGRPVDRIAAEQLKAS